MPHWMQPTKHDDDKIIRKTGFGRPKKNPFMENPLKSVMSILDYRHNLRTDDDYKACSKGIPEAPKKFFNHDDHKIFVPGRNLDVPIKEVKEKNLKLKV